MARKLRIQYPRAIYPVINLGDRRGAILLNDADRRCFLETLAEACTQTGCQRAFTGRLCASCQRGS